MDIGIKKAVDQSCADIVVRATTCGNIALVVNDGQGEKRCEMKVKDAIQLYRRLMGEIDVSMNIPSPSEIYVSFRERDESWTISFSGIVAVLDADDSLAVAWAIRKAVECLTAPDGTVVDPVLVMVASTDGEVKRKAPAVFSSSWSALNGLREFLRPLVNEAVGEASDKDVDLEIDRLISRSEGYGPWMYSADAGRFCVTLNRADVK